MNSPVVAIDSPDIKPRIVDFIKRASTEVTTHDERRVFRNGNKTVVLK